MYLFLGVRVSDSIQLRLHLKTYIVRMYALYLITFSNYWIFQALDTASLADLQVALKGFLQKGETIKLETKVGFGPKRWTGEGFGDVVVFSYFLLIRRRIPPSWVAWLSASGTGMWTCPPRPRLRNSPRSSGRPKSRGRINRRMQRSCL